MPAGRALPGSRSPPASAKGPAGRPAALPGPYPSTYAAVTDAYVTAFACGNIKENLFELKINSQEWEEFLGHFERRRVALGECGRSYSTPCIHEHTCLRCPLLRPSPEQRPRIVEVRSNLTDRIAEAEREGWHGEVEGLKVSLAGADAKLAQLDQMARRAATTFLGMPAFADIAGRAALPVSKDCP
jgi:hypothetical protein